MAGNVYSWSVTAASNDLADASINWQEGQTPGSVNASARGMMAAFASFLKDTNGTITTGGSSNNYTITSPSINYTSLTTGLVIGAKANFTNTGGATLNVNSLGTKGIVVMTTAGEASVAAGQIQNTGHYLFQYDSQLNNTFGAWLLLNPTPDIVQQNPIGVVIPYAGFTNPPTGWLFCYGQAVSRTTYAALFAIIAGFWGGGDGSTTFNVPDLRGRAVFGADDMGGVAASRITTAGSGIAGTVTTSGGAENVSLSTTQIPSHTHTGTTVSGGSHTHTGTTDNEVAGHTHSGTSDNANANHTHSGTTGDDSPDHAHAFSATSTGASVDHTHLVSGNTGTESADHTHQYESHTSLYGGTSGGGQANTGAGNPTLGAPNTATSGKSATHTHTVSITSAGRSADHTHDVSGASGGATARHQHAFTTGTMSVTHAHSYTSGTQSAFHTHTFTTGSSGSHTHTFTSDATGGGTAHTNMPPTLCLNYIIKY